MILLGTGVTVNALHPGIVDTNITRHMSFMKSYMATLILRPLFWPFVKSAKQGAQTTLYCALDPSLDRVTGKYFRWTKQFFIQTILMIIVRLINSISKLYTVL